MALWSDIVGVVVGFAGLGALSVLRKLIIYNWPASKIGKFLAWSPPIQVELGGNSCGVFAPAASGRSRRRQARAYATASPTDA